MLEYGVNPNKSPCTSFDAMKANSKVTEQSAAIRDHLRVCKAFY